LNGVISSELVSELVGINKPPASELEIDP